MANTQAQFGFKQTDSGGAPNYRLTTAPILAAYSTKIFFGDPVIYSTASQYIQPATGTGTALAGIFQGCEFINSSGDTKWSPWWPGTAASDATAYLVPTGDTQARFLVASLLTTVPATAINRNIGFSTGAGGTTVGGGYSTYTVDSSTVNTTLTIQPFRVYGLYGTNGIGNGSDTTTNYGWVIVGFNANSTAVIG